jgi:hypothetical protein
LGKIQQARSGGSFFSVIFTLFPPRAAGHRMKITIRK